VVTTLAEICMIRLEAAARALKDTARVQATSLRRRHPHTQLGFKESRDRAPEDGR
jgi:hypothetical protein